MTVSVYMTHVFIDLIKSESEKQPSACGDGDSCPLSLLRMNLNFLVCIHVDKRIAHVPAPKNLNKCDDCPQFIHSRVTCVMFNCVVDVCVAHQFHKHFKP